MELWIVKIPENDEDELFVRGIAKVDPSSRDRITRFFRRADAWRCLLGRIMARQLQNVLGSNLVFGTTPAGKPYIENNPGTAVAYNVAHDNAIVVLAVDYDAATPAEASIGIDIMRRTLPRGVTVSGFVDILNDQLSDMERLQLRHAHPQVSDSLSNPTLLEHIFWIWTIKEAYTKCLGIGLGFDFRRISIDFNALSLHLVNRESDVRNPDTSPGVVCVDGQPVLGYEFTFFEVIVQAQAAEEIYQGVVARRLRAAISDAPHKRFIGADSMSQSRFIAKNRIKYECRNPASAAYDDGTSQSDDWLKLWDAETLLQTTGVLE